MGLGRDLSGSSIDTGWEAACAIQEEEKYKKAIEDTAKKIESSIEDIGENNESSEESFNKTREKRISEIEKIIEQIEEKNGNVEEVVEAVELLRQVVGEAKEKQEGADNKDTAEALEQVIKEAEENIKIKEAVLADYEKHPSFPTIKERSRL